MRSASKVIGSRPLLAALLLASATGFAPRTPLQHGLRPLAASPLQLRPVLPRARKSPRS